jgi:hypothetical protein
MLAELTPRLDLAITVDTTDRERSAALATAYAKAFRQELPPTPGAIPGRLRTQRSDSRVGRSNSFTAAGS